MSGMVDFDIRVACWTRRRHAGRGDVSVVGQRRRAITWEFALTTSQPSKTHSIAIVGCQVPA